MDGSRLECENDGYKLFAIFSVETYNHRYMVATCVLNKCEWSSLDLLNINMISFILCTRKILATSNRPQSTVIGKANNLPNNGTASDVAGIVSATIFKNTVNDSKIVTPVGMKIM
jgi:hypothetical protein